MYGKDQRVGVSVFLSVDCIECSHRTAFSCLPFLRGQILVSVMHCFPNSRLTYNHPDNPPLRRIAILSRLVLLSTFGHISEVIGPYT